MPPVNSSSRFFPPTLRCGINEHTFHIPSYYATASAHVRSVYLDMSAYCCLHRERLIILPSPSASVSHQANRIFSKRSHLNKLMAAEGGLLLMVCTYLCTIPRTELTNAKFLTLFILLTAKGATVHILVMQMATIDLLRTSQIAIFRGRRLASLQASATMTQIALPVWTSQLQRSPAR